MNIDALIENAPISFGRIECVVAVSVDGTTGLVLSVQATNGMFNTHLEEYADSIDDLFWSIELPKTGGIYRFTGYTTEDNDPDSIGTEAQYLHVGEFTELEMAFKATNQNEL